jgi:hypothetical protein
MVMSVAVLSALVFFVISQVVAALNINGTVRKLKILVMICFIETPSDSPVAHRENVSPPCRGGVRGGV